MQTRCRLCLDAVHAYEHWQGPGLAFDTPGRIIGQLSSTGLARTCAKVLIDGARASQAMPKAAGTLFATISDAGQRPLLHAIIKVCRDGFPMEATRLCNIAHSLRTSLDSEEALALAHSIGKYHAQKLDKHVSSCIELTRLLAALVAPAFVDARVRYLVCTGSLLSHTYSPKAAVAIMRCVCLCVRYTIRYLVTDRCLLIC